MRAAAVVACVLAHAAGAAGAEPPLPRRRAAFWKGKGGKALREKLGLRPHAQGATARGSSSSSSAGASAGSGRRLQGYGGDWPTEHFDVRNSGSTTYLGPGDAPGFCRAALVKQDPTAPASISYGATGVTTQSDSAGWFGGGSDNVLQVGQVFGLDNARLTGLNLAQWSTRGALTPYGIVASGVDYISDIADSVAQPSADGNVYQVWWPSCLAQSLAWEAMPEHFAVHPAHAERGALEAVAPAPAAQGATFDPALAASVYRVNPAAARAAMFVSEAAAANVTAWVRAAGNTPLGDALARAERRGAQSALGDFPPCLQWTAQLNNPSYSPARYLSYGVGAAGPMVLVSETHPSIDTGGVLHAFNADTGAEVWQYATQDAAGKPWGLKGIAPAIDDLGLTGGGIYVAFGSRLVALSPADGSVMATLDAPAPSDPFVASPTLGLMGDELFLHSVSGTLWRVAVALPDGGSLSLSWSWACDYQVIGSGANSTLSDCESQPTAASRMFTRPLRSPRYDASGLTVTGWDSITRGDYVGGGFYQATTRAQRDELWSAILEAHAAAGSGAPEWGTPAGRAAAVAGLTVESAAALAGALPRETLLGLTTPSGYRALGPNGKPLTAAQLASNTLPGTLPLATPAIDESLFSLDDSLVVPQFLPFGRGDEGVFVVAADTGSVLWGFNKWTTTKGDVVAFGRSRSSPVVDGDDYLYVGADIDDPLAPGATIPVLFALDGLMGELVWGSNMGFEPNTTMGASSPAVIDGYDDGNYALVAASDGVMQVGEGWDCPTNDAAFECSGHGTCSCVTGTCSCGPTPCFGGSDCSDQCAHGGTCSDDLGACVCPPNYDAASMCKQCDPCHTGPDTGCVQVANLCNLHGTCVVAGGLPTCACDDGWGGMGCTQQTKLTPTQQADVGAAVGVPLALLALGAAGLVYMRRKGLTWGDVVPERLAALGSSLRRGGGFAPAAFTSSSSLGGGGDVSTPNALFSPAADKSAGKEGAKLLGGRSYGAL